MTIPDPVAAHARQRPDAPALDTGAEVWTWKALDARVSAAAAALADAPRASGPVPEAVAVQRETSPALVALVLGAFRARRVLVPLSTRWTDAAVADVLAALGIADVWNDGGGARATASRAASDAEAWTLSAPVTIVHTSGSTGRPKAILHTVENHVESARGVVDALRLGADGRWLLDLPLYHVGGLGVVVRCALAGATLAVPPRTVAPAEAVGRLRPTHASFVATQLRRLLDGGADLSALRAVLLGGSALPTDLLDRAVAAGVPAVASYGMTEMTSTVTATALGAGRDALATSGVPLPSRHVRMSHAGEIEVGGPTLAARVDAGGVRTLGPWHATGDLGRFDAHGRLVVTGRRDLMFVSGGENVHPERIESALVALRAVADAVVVPISDDEFQNRPAAFVRPADGYALDPDALAGALRRTLPSFMVPVAFHEWNGGAGLKPDRPALTREAERRAAEPGDA